MGDTVEVGHHFVVGEPHNLISFLRYIGITTRVSGNRRVADMRVAVNFDDQPPVMTDEIAKIGAEPLLLAEFVTVEAAIAQHRPQRRFSRSAIAAQLPCAGYAAIVT